MLYNPVPTELRPSRARCNGCRNLSLRGTSHHCSQGDRISSQGRRQPGPTLLCRGTEHLSRSVYESSRALEVAGFK